MEKTWLFIKGHLALIIAIAVGLLSYICFGGAAFSYEDEAENEVFLSFVDTINASPASYGFFVYLALILPGVGIVLLGLSLVHRYFGLAGMAVLFADAIFAFFLPDFLEYGIGYDLGFEFFGSWLPSVTLVAACFALFTVSSSEKIEVADMAEMGMLIGMAFILNLFKLFTIGADGGSVNLQMIPLFILALRRGPVKGFVACGIVYGLLTCLTDGYGFATYPFDYLIGFGSTALIGFFRPLIFSSEQTTYNLKGEVFIFLAGLSATIMRLVGSTISSVVVYDYTLAAGLIYNLTYIPLSGLFGIIVLMAIYGPMIKIEKMFPVNRK